MVSLLFAPGPVLDGDGTLTIPRMAFEPNSPTQLRSVKEAIEPTFTPFKRLPQELQNNIWQCAIDNVSPRIVELRRGLLKELPDGDFLWTNQFTSTCPIPSTLHTCRNARQLAMKRWKLVFAFRTQCPKVFFDFHNDTLYFGCKFDNISPFVKDVSATDRSALREIALDLQEQWDSGYYDCGRNLAKRLHRDFPGITDLIFTERDLDSPYNDPLGKPLMQSLNRTYGVVSFRKAAEIWGTEGFSSIEFAGTFKKNKWALPRIRHMDYYRTPSFMLLTGDEPRNTISGGENVENVRGWPDDEPSDEEGTQLEHSLCRMCGHHHELDDDDSDGLHEETEDDTSSPSTEDEYDSESDDLVGEIEDEIEFRQAPHQNGEEDEDETDGRLVYEVHAGLVWYDAHPLPHPELSP